jgi:hypothetical protein
VGFSGSKAGSGGRFWWFSGKPRTPFAAFVEIAGNVAILPKLDYYLLAFTSFALSLRQRSLFLLKSFTS